MEIPKNSSTRNVTIAVTVILFAVYNTVVFVIPFKRDGGFWTGYAFSVVAICLAAFVFIYAISNKSPNSRFFGMPLVKVALGYLIAQLPIGLLEMSLSFIPFKYGIALNTILFGGCIIALIVANAAKENSQNIEEHFNAKIKNIRVLQTKVELLVARASDESTKKTLKALAEKIRYSDPMSSPELAELEDKIKGKIDSLAEALNNAGVDAVKALCDELQLLFTERNKMCMILK